MKFGVISVREYVRNGKTTGKWFVDIPASLTNTGKRKRRLYRSRRHAETIAREVSRKLRMRTLGYADNTRKTGLVLRDGIEMWKEAQLIRVRTRKLCASSLEVNEFRLKPLVAFLGTYDIAALRSDDLERYQENRLAVGCAPATINSEIATLRQVLKWLAEHGHGGVVPNVQRVRPARRQLDIPTADETVRLISCLPPRLRTLVRLLAETGMRVGEVLNLPWGHVHETDGYLEVQAHGEWQPKNNRSFRRVPLSQGLLAEIRKLPRRGFYVFPGQVPDKPIDNFRKALARAVKKAGLVRNGVPMKITAKTFRKAFASWQASKQVHPSILQAMMGHAPGSRMTDQFYIFANEDMKRAVVLELPQSLNNDSQRANHVAKSGNAA